MSTWGKLIAVVVGMSVAVLMMALLIRSTVKGREVRHSVSIVDATGPIVSIKPDIVISSLPPALMPPERPAIPADEPKIAAAQDVVAPAVEPAPVVEAQPKVTPLTVTPAPKIVKAAPVKKKLVKVVATKPKTVFVRVKKWFDGLFDAQR